MGVSSAGDRTHETQPLAGVGRDHPRAQAKSRLLSFRRRAAMNVSELENWNDDMPQGVDVCRTVVSKRKWLTYVGATDVR